MTEKGIFQESRYHEVNSGIDKKVFLLLFLIIRMTFNILLFLRYLRLLEESLSKKMFNFIKSHFKEYFFNVSPSVLFIILIGILILLNIEFLLLYS